VKRRAKEALERILSGHSLSLLTEGFGKKVFEDLGLGASVAAIWSEIGRVERGIGARATGTGVVFEATQPDMKTLMLAVGVEPQVLGGK